MIMKEKRSDGYLDNPFEVFDEFRIRNGLVRMFYEKEEKWEIEEEEEEERGRMKRLPGGLWREERSMEIVEEE